MPDRSTERRLLDIERSIEWLRRAVTNFPVRWGRKRMREPGRFIGVITASVVQSNYEARWDYTVRRCTATAAGWSVASGSAALTATNRRELSHDSEPSPATPWYVWGVDVHGPAYPSTFYPQPVGGGGLSAAHRTDVYVEIEIVIEPDGTVRYEFDAMGSHDGDCAV